MTLKIFSSLLIAATIGLPALAQSTSNHIPLVDPLIKSERIDGPANIRVSKNGKIIFSLNDNVPVTSTDTTGKWCKIGIFIDLTPEQVKSHLIPKGSRLFSDGVEAGKAAEDINLYEDDLYKEGGTTRAGLQGYTSGQNIKSQTQPENIISEMITQNPSLTKSQLNDFIKGFQFTQQQDKMGVFTTFQLDGSFAYGPSTPLRLLLVFDKDKLFGIVHLRKLNYQKDKPYLLKAGYFFTLTGDPDRKKAEDFIKHFDQFISAAG